MFDMKMMSSVFCLWFICKLLLLLPLFSYRYVPALRPLRQQAFLLAFPQTQPSRLTQRLAEVSTSVLKKPKTKRIYILEYIEN